MYIRLFPKTNLKLTQIEFNYVSASAVQLCLKWQLKRFLTSISRN